ncbi:hypothetical protein MP638_005724 [Amoeboaphelidium occidentale]|nr:hypothetical protein MP638_005724 [Amoeboaphelidium occidentale]
MSSKQNYQQYTGGKDQSAPQRPYPISTVPSSERNGYHINQQARYFQDSYGQPQYDSLQQEKMALDQSPSVDKSMLSDSMPDTRTSDGPSLVGGESSQFENSPTTTSRQNDIYSRMMPPQEVPVRGSDAKKAFTPLDLEKYRQAAPPLLSPRGTRGPLPSPSDERRFHPYSPGRATSPRSYQKSAQFEAIQSRNALNYPIQNGYNYERYNQAPVDNIHMYGGPQIYGNAGPMQYAQFRPVPSQITIQQHQQQYQRNYGYPYANQIVTVRPAIPIQEQLRQNYTSQLQRASPMQATQRFVPGQEMYNPQQDYMYQQRNNQYMEQEAAFAIASLSTMSPVENRRRPSTTDDIPQRGYTQSSLGNMAYQTNYGLNSFPRTGTPPKSISLTDRIPSNYNPIQKLNLTPKELQAYKQHAKYGSDEKLSTNAVFEKAKFSYIDRDAATGLNSIKNRTQSEEKPLQESNEKKNSSTSAQVLPSLRQVLLPHTPNQASVQRPSKQEPLESIPETPKEAPATPKKRAIGRIASLLTSSQKKPFKCPVVGCDKAFYKESHLNTNRKDLLQDKKEFVLDEVMPLDKFQNNFFQKAKVYFDYVDGFTTSFTSQSQKGSCLTLLDYCFGALLLFDVSTRIVPDSQPASPTTADGAPGLSNDSGPKEEATSNALGPVSGQQSPISIESITAGYARIKKQFPTSRCIIIADDIIDNSDFRIVINNRNMANCLQAEIEDYVKEVVTYILSSIVLVESQKSGFPSYQKYLKDDEKVVEETSAVESPLSSFNEQLKEKKRLPGRVQKRIGELYLLGGCWGKAIISFQNAIELLRKMDDPIHYSSTLEGFLTTQLLINPSFVTSAEFIEKEEELNQLLSDIVDPLVKCQLVLRLSNLYLEYKKDPWECCKRIMKVWDCGVDELLKEPKGIDQIRIASQMSDLFGRIKYQRKRAFFTRQCALLILARVIDLGPKVLAIQEKNLYSHSSRGSKSSSTSVTPLDHFEEEEIVRTYYEYSKRMVEYIVESLVTYCCMDNYDEFTTDLKETNRVRNSLFVVIHRPKKSEGKYACYDMEKSWRSIFTEVAKEAVRMCELVQEYELASLFLGYLLLDSLSNPSANAQFRYWNTLCKIANKMTYKPSLYTFPSRIPTVLSTSDESRYRRRKLPHSLLGHFVKRYSIATEPSQSRYPSKVEVEKASQEVIAAKDGLFLHDPFAKKKESTQKVEWVIVGETFEMNFVIMNPFECNIQVLEVGLVVDCKSIAEHVHVELAGLPVNFDPKEEFELTIPVTIVKFMEKFTVDGLMVKFSNGWIEYLRFPSQFSLQVHKYNPPILKLLRSSLVRNTDLMIYEGERAEVLYEMDLIPSHEHGDLKLDFVVVDTTETCDSPITWITHRSVGEAKFESRLYDASVTALAVKKITSMSGDTLHFPFKPVKSTQNSVNFIFSCVGKRGLNGCSIRIKYGQIIDGTTYSRTLRLKINTTVESPLEVVNLEFARNFIGSNPTIRSDSGPRITKSLSVEEIALMDAPSSNAADDSCLCVIDIRNNWNSLFSVRFLLPQSSTESEENYFVGPSADTTTKTDFTAIYPKQTKRFVLLVEKISIDDIIKRLQTILPPRQDDLFNFNLLPFDPLYHCGSLNKRLPPIPQPNKVSLGPKPVVADTARDYTTNLTLYEKKLKSTDAEVFELENAKKDFLESYIAERQSRLSFFCKHHFFQTGLLGMEWTNSANSVVDSLSRSGFFVLRSYASLSASDLLNLCSREISVKYDVIAGGNYVAPTQENVYLVPKDHITELVLKVQSTSRRLCYLRTQYCYDVCENDGLVGFDISNKMLVNGSLQALLCTEEDPNEGFTSNHSISLKFRATGSYKMLYHLEYIEEIDNFDKSQEALITRYKKLFGDDSLDAVEWCQEPIIFKVE